MPLAHPSCRRVLACIRVRWPLSLWGRQGHARLTDRPPATGHGLSYYRFQLSNLRLSKRDIPPDGPERKFAGPQQRPRKGMELVTDPRGRTRWGIRVANYTVYSNTHSVQNPLKGLGSRQHRPSRSKRTKNNAKPTLALTEAAFGVWNVAFGRTPVRILA